MTTGAKLKEGFRVKKIWQKRFSLGAVALTFALLATGCGGSDKLVSDPQAKYEPVPQAADELRVNSAVTAAIYDAFDNYFAHVPHDGALVLQQSVDSGFGFRNATKKNPAYPVVSKIVCYDMRVGYAAGGITPNDSSLGIRLAPDERPSKETYAISDRDNYINLVLSSKQGSKELLSNDFMFFQDAQNKALTEQWQITADRGLLVTPHIPGKITLEKVDDGVKITYERPNVSPVTQTLPMKVYGFIPDVAAHNFAVTVEMYQ